MPKPASFIGIGALLSLALTACSSVAAPPAPTPMPLNAATPVPISLQGYASLADPTLKATVREGESLLRVVQSASKSSYETLGNECSQVGGDLSNYNSSFRETYVPVLARSVYHDATQAYKVLLASSDECGMAADSHDKKSLKSAAEDMKHALSVLKRAESAVSPWYKAQG